MIAATIGSAKSRGAHQSLMRRRLECLTRGSTVLDIALPGIAILLSRFP
jgi:hypothetical protein